MREKYIFCLFTILIGIYLFSCSGSKSKPTSFVKEGKYSFILSDTADIKLCDGTILIETTQTDKIFGKYEITKKYVDTINGLNSDMGYFEGKADKKTNSIFINLNPKIADANVFIDAKVSDDSLIGDWRYSTLNGIQNKGKFKAVFNE